MVIELESVRKELMDLTYVKSLTTSDLEKKCKDFDELRLHADSLQEKCKELGKMTSDKDSELKDMENSLNEKILETLTMSDDIIN